MAVEQQKAGVRVGLVGLGSIGRHAARLLLDHRHEAEIVAAATLESEVVGRPLHEVVKASRTSPVRVASSLADVLAHRPDVVVLATGSFLSDVAEDVIAIASAGTNVVSPCEELAFPFDRDHGRATAIHRAAEQGGATVLGTGVNPGFIFDSLLVLCSGASWTLDAIRGRRVVDVSGFGRAIHRRLGIGYLPQEFETGHSDGTIAGHVGFPESIQMICERLGLQLTEDVIEEFEPLIATTSAPASYGDIEPGRTEGFIQRATGIVGGAVLISFELVLHVRPRAAGFEPADTLELEGLHPIRLKLSPGMDAILATSAMLVNSIPVVIHSKPGLMSVKDVPTAGAWIDRTPSETLR